MLRYDGVPYEPLYSSYHFRRCYTILSISLAAAPPSLDWCPFTHADESAKALIFRVITATPHSVEDPRSRYRCATNSPSVLSGMQHDGTGSMHSRDVSLSPGRLWQIADQAVTPHGGEDVERITPRARNFAVSNSSREMHGRGTVVRQGR